MTQTNDTAPEAPSGGSATRKRGGGLNGMLLADLKAMAGALGIRGSGSMKKAQLVEAIKAAQSSSGGAPSGGAASGGAASGGAPPQARTQGPGVESAETGGEPPAAEDGQKGRQPRQDRTGQQPRQQRDRGAAGQEAPGKGATGQQGAGKGATGKDRAGKDRDQDAAREGRTQEQDQSSGREQREQAKQRDRDQGGRDQGGRDQAGRDQGGRGQQPQGGPQQPQGAGDDDEAGSRRNRRRRGRDRERAVRSGREPDTSILEDDVLVPAAGILDVLENYAFVRTSGYLPGADDVYVSLSMVRKHGLRRGDAVVGQVRQPREGERREKFNPLVRIDSINGADPDSAQERPEFESFTPVHPEDRLRLETDAANMTGRIIDLTAPIGKGQRGLIVSPPKAGKTMVLQSVAASITANNPECHLMVVLIDERPEEVTDFQRSIKGEVIASTFDRPASDHTMLAELAIERAKRLVELGHDVVVLLDSITRLGRAYNLSAPPSGRILSGGVDSSALYPPKKFFGAARNVEDGGSLTILATALVETGSKMDEVIFEEFKGTGNMELRLRREVAEKRIFPAIDPVQSGTRREELLMGTEEQAIVWKLRHVLAGQEPQPALELLLERLRKTQTNIEFLTQVQRTTPREQDR